MNLGFGRKIWELLIGEWSLILFHNKNHVFEGKFEVFWKRSKDLRVINSKMVERFERYEFVSGFWFYFQKNHKFSLKTRENLRFFGKCRKIWELWIRVLVERFESNELVSGVWFYFQKTSNFLSKLEKIWDFLENVERFESYEFRCMSKD